MIMTNAEKVNQYEKWSYWKLQVYWIFLHIIEELVNGNFSHWLPALESLLRHVLDVYTHFIISVAFNHTGYIILSSGSQSCAF